MLRVLLIEIVACTAASKHAGPGPQSSFTACSRACKLP